MLSKSADQVYPMWICLKYIVLLVLMEYSAMLRLVDSIEFIVCRVSVLVIPRRKNLFQWNRFFRLGITWDVQPQSCSGRVVSNGFALFAFSLTVLEPEACKFALFISLLWWNVLRDLKQQPLFRKKKVADSLPMFVFKNTVVHFLL